MSHVESNQGSIRMQARLADCCSVWCTVALQPEREPFVTMQHSTTGTADIRVVRRQPRQHTRVSVAMIGQVQSGIKA